MVTSARGHWSARLSERLRLAQTGFARSYALSMFARRGPGGRGDAGGEVLVTGIPWLTILWLLPDGGRRRSIMLLPPAQRALAK